MAFFHGIQVFLTPAAISGFILKMKCSFRWPSKDWSGVASIAPFWSPLQMLRIAMRCAWKALHDSVDLCDRAVMFYKSILVGKTTLHEGTNPVKTCLYMYCMYDSSYPKSAVGPSR